MGTTEEATHRGPTVTRGIKPGLWLGPERHWVGGRQGLSPLVRPVKSPLEDCRRARRVWVVGTKGSRHV